MEFHYRISFRVIVILKWKWNKSSYLKEIRIYLKEMCSWFVINNSKFIKNERESLKKTWMKYYFIWNIKTKISKIPWRLNKYILYIILFFSFFFFIFKTLSCISYNNLFVFNQITLLFFKSKKVHSKMKRIKYNFFQSINLNIIKY